MRSTIFASAALIALGACTSTDLNPVAPVRSPDNVNRSITIENDTPLAMTNIRARNAETGQWTTNLFNRLRLQANSERTVMMDDGSNSCMYSFHANFENGQQISNPAVDICGGGTWRIYTR